MGAPDDTENMGAVVDAALALARTQLLAQVADDASLDGRATGLVGFNGVLLAATIPAKELLGKYWYAPAPVVIVGTLMLLWGLYGGRRIRDLLLDLWRPRHRVDVGIPALQFYVDFAAGPSLVARERLLRDLDEAVKKNKARIARKQRWLQAATLWLVAGLAVAGVLIAFNTPTKMKSCPSRPKCHSPSQQGSNTSGPAAQSPKTDGELVELAEEIEAGRDGPLVHVADEIEGR